MDFSFAAAMLAGFIALLILANVGNSVLTNWSTPVTREAPATMSSSLAPAPNGSLEPPPVASIPTINGITTRAVIAPGTGQQIAVMPVPVNPPSPPPLGNPGQTGTMPGDLPLPTNSVARGDELPPAPRSY